MIEARPSSAKLCWRAEDRSWSDTPIRLRGTRRDGSKRFCGGLAYPNEVGSLDRTWAVALLVLSIVYLAMGEIASRGAEAPAA